MSALRKRLSPIIDGLAKDANKNHDREVKARYYFLRAVCRSKQSVTRACARAGKSTDSFEFWAKRLIKQKTFSALKSKSRKPKRSPNQVAKRVERKIIALRRAEPSFGPERISFDMKKVFNLDVSPGRVYRTLKRNNLISTKHSKSLTKRHIKRYRRPLPGHLQLDVKYVPYRINGEQYYQFNAVDHCTTWRLSRIYRSLTYYSLINFLKELDGCCPFPIVQIQTDNGIEFTDKFRGNVRPTGKHPLDRWCKFRGIHHKLIPVGQKELNGKVENTHKQDDREFYSKYAFKNFESLERVMRGYCDRWNTVRATKSLEWRTPVESLEWACVRAIAYLEYLRSRFSLPLETSERERSEVSQGRKSIIPEQPKPAAAAKPKKLSAVDRYLQWLEWDESRKRLKAVLLLPQMSQNFSTQDAKAFPVY
jgi:hypothetical protein